MRAILFTGLWVFAGMAPSLSAQTGSSEWRKSFEKLIKDDKDRQGVEELDALVKAFGDLKPADQKSHTRTSRCCAFSFTITRPSPYPYGNSAESWGFPQRSF